MKHWIFLGLFIIISITSHSQAVINQSFTYKVTQGFLDSEYQLSIFDDFAIWEQTIAPELNSNVPVSGELKNNKDLLYKDYNKNKIYKGYKISGNSFVVSDSLRLLNWQITNEFKNILDYECQAATTKFRGREYIAYFTSEIPLSEGPFKFNGLPGMILKVSNINPKKRENIDSEDIYSWECIAINSSAKTKTLEYSNHKENIISISKDNTVITWNELKQKAHKLAEVKKKSMQTLLKSKIKSGATMTLTKENSAEIYHEELQTTGLTIKF